MSQIPCPLQQSARTHPGRTALTDGKRTLTYAGFDAAVDSTVSLLQSHDVSHGDRIAILAANSIEQIILIQALQRLGATAVPLNLRVTVEQWRRQCEAARVTQVWYDSDRESAARSLSATAQTLAQLTTTLNLTGNTPASESAPVHLKLEQEASIIFTSGSSGDPKAVVLTVGNHYYSAAGSNLNIKVDPDDCWLICLPLYHVGGLGIIDRCLIAGAAIRAVSRFDAIATIELLQAERITHISVVPTMLREMMLADSEGALNKAKAILLGGAAADRQLIDEIIAKDLPVLTTFGFTEAGSQVTTVSPSDPKCKLHSSGQPLKHRIVRIVDDRGNELPAGESGQIAVGGEILFKGYIAASAQTRMTSDGLFLTGDLGYFDSDGYLHVTGRIEEMIISGGENIDPAEIVAAALSHPGVVDAAALAIADPQWGQRPCLFVVDDQTRSVGESELGDHLRQELARMKLPDRIISIDRIPRTALGKVDYPALRKLIENSESS
jgi:O-succinylbenzoic acid--CoA ligase